jgi:hypothetical protein
MRSTLQFSILTLVAMVLAGCGGSTDEPAAAAKDEPPTVAARTPSSPGNLFRIDYEIIGTPVVGSPVSVDVAITALSSDEPVDLAFRIPDATALTLDAAQLSDLRRTPSSDDRTIRERVTVIPQREGRLFINVSASRTDDAGSLTSAVSIPIHVGNVDTSIREQGELQTNEDGETTRVLTSE